MSVIIHCLIENSNNINLLLDKSAMQFTKCVEFLFKNVCNFISSINFYFSLVFNTLCANYEMIINLFGCIIVMGCLIGIKEIIFKDRVPGAKGKKKGIKGIYLDKNKG